MLAELYSWWTRQMADLLEPLVRRLAAYAPDGVLIRPDPAAPDGSGAFTILQRRKGTLQSLAHVPADAEPALHAALNAYTRNKRLVLFSPRPPLIREVMLPRAAEPELDRVLHHEMDRLTPFTVRDVCYTHRVLGHDRARAMLRVELAIMPLAWIAVALQRLTGAGVAPTLLEAVLPDGRTLQIPISPRTDMRSERIRLLCRSMAVVCVALACAIIGAPVVCQSLELSEVEDRIGALRPHVEEVEALRRQIAASQSAAGQVALAHRQAAEALTTLGVLTDTLADDTWLSMITIRQRRLVFEGRSTTATKLISVLAADRHFRNPAFIAPVLRSNAGAEIFTIQAEFEP